METAGRSTEQALHFPAVQMQAALDLSDGIALSKSLY